MKRSSPATAHRPHDRAAREGMAALAIFLAAVVVIWVGVGLLTSPTGVEDTVAAIYRLVGARGAAADVASYGLAATTEKLVRAIVAIGLGVGGLWAVLLSCD